MKLVDHTDKIMIGKGGHSRAKITIERRVYSEVCTIAKLWFSRRKNVQKKISTLFSGKLKILNYI